MSIYKYIKENIEKLGSNTYVAPDIPDKRLDGALTSYANDVELEHVVALKDSSLLHNGKEGCLFLGDAVYLKAPFERPYKLEYAQLNSIEYFEIERETRFNKIKLVGQVHAAFKNDSVDDLTPLLTNVNLRGFTEFMEGIIEKGQDGVEFVNTSQITPLSEMSEDIKFDYMKLIANFTHSDDGLIDPNEYAEIISLISRIDLSSPKRLEIRNYISDMNNLEENDTLFEKLESSVEKGSFDILGKSLFKDMLYIFSKNNDIHAWKNNEFLQQIKEQFNMSDQEAELIISAIENDEAILKERKNDSEIKKSMKDIAAKAAAVGVPMATIYFSGSVVGLSAAGITSGLATMGMGGLLGFSSMFTGIGTIVLLGVGTYQGVKKVTGISDLENNKQREFMLQAIIRNSQKSLSFLIEDINEITKQLTAEVKKGNANSEKIEKLSGLLQMLSQGAQINSDRQEHSRIEQMITRLPEKLDETRLNELTNKPTLEKYRHFILSSYAIQSDDEEKNVLLLRDDLTLSDVEKLHECFEKIDYIELPPLIDLAV